MSESRRTYIKVFFSDTDITEAIEPYLISLSYTDNEEDETDDLQINLHDREGIWLEQWLNSMLQSAISSESSSASSSPSESENKRYNVIETCRVREMPTEAIQPYGTVYAGDVIDVVQTGSQWATVIFGTQTAYIPASALGDEYVGKSVTSDGVIESKGMKISAAIVSDSGALDCGIFELDSVTAQGPPATVTVKGTSLPYTASVRQTEKSKSWESYSLSGIANEIASNNGMACMFLPSKNPHYERVEQYKQSDIQFLQKLCRDAGFSLKASNNIIIVFDQKAYEQNDAVRTVEHGPNGGYGKYKLSTGENDVYTSCRVTYTGNDGNTITGTATNESYKADDTKHQVLEITQRVTSEAEASELAAQQLRLHNKYELQAEFTFPGDPTLCAGSVMRLEGFGAWSGNYIIKSAVHNVDSNGYTTKVNLRYGLVGNDYGKSDAVSEPFRLQHNSNMTTE